MSENTISSILESKRLFLNNSRNVEGLDARVYREQTNLMPPSPSLMPVLNIVNMGKTYFPSKQSNDLIKTDAETKKAKQVTMKPDIPISNVRVPSKYAKTYELEKFKGNRMLISNHNEFRDSSRRPGTDLDQEALIQTFSKYRFEVQSYNNLSKHELMSTLKQFAEADFSEYGCVCVAILTHGHEKPGYLEAYDKHYSEYELLEPFDTMKNPTLAAKPIIFIIQACRGTKPSMKVTLDRRMSSKYQLDLDDDDNDVYHLPTDADIIVFHSSAVGRASVRHPFRGSWFIQTLCKTIQEHADTEDLETIFRLVRRTVALEFVNSRDWKQMPVVTSTLLREIYLVPSGQISPSKYIMDISCKDSEIHNQLSNKPKDPWPETSDESPDSSLTKVQPIHMPELHNQLSNKAKDPWPETSDESPDSSLTKVQPIHMPELHNQLSNKAKDPWPETSDESPDSSLTKVQPIHMPCSCFLEYFEYLKKCLEFFVQHNPEDVVAKNLLKMTQRVGDGAEYNVQKFSFIQSMWEHFEANMDKFPQESSKFVYRKYM